MPNNNLHAYLFWYKTDEYATTEYVYVVAYSYKQARHFWFNYLKYTLGWACDYQLTPCDVIDGNDFMKQHKAGDILGQYAII